LAVLPRDEPLLEREPAFVGPHLRPEPVVGRRKQAHTQAEPLGEPRRHGRERLAAAERLRPDEMEPDVAVAETEPRVAAEASRLLERVPRLVRAAPAALLVAEAGEPVENAVEVRRDVPAEP